MNKQTQCCCICLETCDDDIHQFSCCVGVMHLACFAIFRKSKTANFCPYCRRNQLIPRPIYNNNENENYEPFNSILDFM